jgi:hypothetical protein
MLKPHRDALADCQRYFSKSYSQGTAVGTVNTSAGSVGAFYSASATGAAGGVIAGSFRFPVPMALVPTVTIYNWSTGASGSVADFSGPPNSYTGASTNAAGTSGFPYVIVSSIPPGNAVYGIHYAADTAW